MFDLCFSAKLKENTIYNLCYNEKISYRIIDEWLNTDDYSAV